LPNARRGGVIRVGTHQASMFESTRGLDPLFTLDSQMAEMAANLYSTLLRYEDGVIVPALAERWEADPSARRYRFYLRRNARFHDGTPFTARDAKRHFERLLDPVQRSSDSWIFREVEGAADFLAGRAREVPGLEVLDDHTLEIRLTEPKAFFLQLVALPGTAVARVDAQGALVGTGPFRPVKVDGSGVVFERSPFYFAPEQPLLDRLEFRLYPQRQDAIDGLKGGEVDLVSGLFAENVTGDEFDAHQVIVGSTPSCWFLGFNLRDAPYSDPRVRQAIRYGLDIQGMVEKFHPGAHVAKRLTPPGLLEGEAAGALPRPDLSVSTGLLRQAGVSKLRLALYYPQGRNTDAEDLILFRPLVEAGLAEVSHVELPASEFWRKMAEGRIPAFRAGWIADYPDADNFLHFLLNSNAQTVYSLGYSNPEVDRLTTEARVSIDPETRAQNYWKAERLVAEDCPIIPLYHERTYAAATPLVQGLRLHQTPPHVRFEYLWVDHD